MQLLADFFPLILFFIAFKWQGIYVATGVAIAASIVQIAFLRWKRGRVSAVHWLSLAIIVAFRRSHADPAGRNVHQMEADRPLRAVRCDPRRGQACSRTQLTRPPAAGNLVAEPRLDRASRGRGSRSSRFMGVANLVCRLPLPDRNVGQFQGLGRHRPLPRVRARAGMAAGAARAGGAVDEPRSRLGGRRAVRAPGAARASCASGARNPGRQRGATRGMPAPQGGAGHFSLLIVSERFAGLAAARAAPARAEPASPTSCRIRSTRFRSRR